MIETGDVEALRCAHAEGRLVAPVDVSSSQDQWIVCALLALQPQIADWLLATFGSLVIPCDGGAYVDSRLWNHENPHVAHNARATGRRSRWSSRRASSVRSFMDVRTSVAVV